MKRANKMNEAEKRQARIDAGKLSRKAAVQIPPKDNTIMACMDGYRKVLETKLDRDKISNLEKSLGLLNTQFETLAALTSAPLEPVTIREHGYHKKREATAVALLSDLHVDEPVRLGETPVKNEYNPAIADTSMNRFFSGLEWLIKFHREVFEIRDIVLWLGGDFMSGHIHEELKISTSGTPIETLLWLRPRLQAGIDFLLKDPKTERIIIPCSYGNHGRTTFRSYRSLGAVHSYEWLLYQWLGAIYENEPRVSILADRSAHQYLKVYDWDLHFHHGDEANYGGGIGGITVPLNKAISQWDKAAKCHYHNFGHWHQYLDTGRLALNGSMIGYSAYSMSIKAEPEPPVQSFYLIDSKRGKTCKSPIWVRD